MCSDPSIGLDTAGWQEPGGKPVPFADCVPLGVQWAMVKGWHGRHVTKTGRGQFDLARASGLIPGEYAWLLPDEDLAMQIGAWCAKPIESFQLPHSIDFEHPDTKLRGRQLVMKLEYTIERYSDRMGHRPIIYTGEWYWSGYCSDVDSQLVAECPLWLAAYPRKANGGTRYTEAVAEVCGGKMPRVPVPWRERDVEPLMWQLDGDKGLYLPNGVDVDVNVAAWARLQALVPERAIKPEPYVPFHLRTAPLSPDVPDALDVVRKLADN